MAGKVWTYETLGQQNNDTFEQIVRTSERPDLDVLNGKIYAGWLHGFRGKLSGIFVGTKFKKGFALKDGKVTGYNENVDDDGKGPVGEWPTELTDGQPTHRGFFRCAYVEDEPYQKMFKNYRHCTYFNYDIPEVNRGVTNTLSRVIRDFAVLPNPGDHSLMLVKAYFKPFKGFYFWHSFFLLGHPEEIKYPPQWGDE